MVDAHAQAKPLYQGLVIQINIVKLGSQTAVMENIMMVVTTV